MGTEHLGVRLARLRHAASLTQEQLAERADVSVDVIRKLEQQRKNGVRLETLGRLATALGVPAGDLVDAPPAARAPQTRARPGPLSSAGCGAERLVKALIRITAEDAARSGEHDAAAPVRVLPNDPTDDLAAVPELAEVQELHARQPTVEDVAILEDTAVAFRTWDHRYGGRLHRRAAVGQLAQLGGLLAVPQPRVVARRLFSVASRLALIVAQMSADAGMPHRARAYRLLAIESAKVARDTTRLARAVNAEARAALTSARPDAAVHLLSNVRTLLGAEIAGDTSALLAATEAWAYARKRESDRVREALDRAGRCLDGVAGAPGTVFGMAELEGVSGACYEYLASAGVGSRAHAKRAEGHIEMALTLRASAYARSRVFDLAGLVHVNLLQDKPDQAAYVGRQAVDAASRLHSTRVRMRLHHTAVQSLSLFPDVPEIREFTDAVRTCLPSPSR